MNQMATALKEALPIRKCWPKEQHSTKGKAEAQMRSITKRGLEKDRDTIHVYECACGSWHVGHYRRQS